MSTFEQQHLDYLDSRAGTGGNDFEPEFPDEEQVKPSTCLWHGEFVKPYELDETGEWVSVRLVSTGASHLANINELEGFHRDSVPQVVPEKCEACEGTGKVKASGIAQYLGFIATGHRLEFWNCLECGGKGVK